jgi:hypothetical protein
MFRESLHIVKQQGVDQSAKPQKLIDSTTFRVYCLGFSKVWMSSAFLSTGIL